MKGLEPGGTKDERAALKYLRRDRTHTDPSVADVAQLAAVLTER
jgi:hypothetical protein